MSQTTASQIFEAWTMDFTARFEYTSAHGRTWKRAQEKTPQGYRMGAWREVGGMPGDASPTQRTARVPAPDPEAPKKARTIRKPAYFVAGPAAAGESLWLVSHPTPGYMGCINAATAQEACERACAQRGYSYYTPDKCTAVPAPPQIQP